MPLIDQRILIDTPPQIIWDFISDPDRLTRWHTGYSGVSVLTTQRTGANTRRRCTPAGGGGKDVIEEITAWVEGLGYEYSVIDGGPYRTFQGRLRLQPGPDGTTVQWTITYRPKGLIGLLRDQLSGRRQLAQMMADSLRQLRRQIDALGVRMDQAQRAKMSIQGRLDANARAQYQRRYAPPPGLDTTAVQDNAIPTAALAEDQPAAAPPTVPDVPVAAVPSFVTDLTGESLESEASHKADTQPRPPEGLREAIAARQTTKKREGSRTAGPEITAADAQPAPPERIEPPPAALPVQAPVRPPAMPEPTVQPMKREPKHKRITPPHGIPVVRPSFVGEPPSDEIPTKPKPPREIEASSQIAPTQHPATLPPQTPIHDTGEISIWEVFGVKRPSEQDNETLEDLIRSVRQKKSESKRRVGQRMARGTLRARHVDTVVGLRVWLALREAHIRLIEALYRDGE